MKRILLVLIISVLLLSCTSCAQKTTSVIKINSDSVNSITFKSNSSENCKQKLITEPADIKNICSWLKSFKLTKHSAIEIPVSNVTYLIQIDGKADHQIIFMDEFIIYDMTAYTFDNKSDYNSVKQKYNLFAYKETDCELGLL